MPQYNDYIGRWYEGPTRVFRADGLSEDGTRMMAFGYHLNEKKKTLRPFKWMWASNFIMAIDSGRFVEITEADAMRWVERKSTECTMARFVKGAKAQEGPSQARGDTMAEDRHQNITIEVKGRGRPANRVLDPNSPGYAADEAMKAWFEKHNRKWYVGRECMFCSLSIIHNKAMDMDVAFVDGRRFTGGDRCEDMSIYLLGSFKEYVGKGDLICIGDVSDKGAIAIWDEWCEHPSERLKIFERAQKRSRL